MFARAQVEQVGATRAMIRARVSNGRWEQVTPTVFRLAGAPRTWRQRAFAACLSQGQDAAVSHRAAAALSKLLPEPRRIDITTARARNRRRPAAVAVHRPAEPLGPDDVTTLGGIPVTRPARLLLDLAASEREPVVGRCLDECLRRKLVSLPFLERWLNEAGAFRPGARLLRRLVYERAVLGVTDSELETRVLRLLRNSGLPIPHLQYEVHDRGAFLGRVDLAYPDARVAIEVDGFAPHSGKRAFHRDRARANDIQAAGWTMLRITSQHLDHPEQVVAWLRDLLDR